MKIVVKDGKKVSIKLRLPTVFALRIIFKYTSVSKDGLDLKDIAKSVRAARKQWGRLKLMEVESADGSYVLITL